jgi:hypothetical protein
MPGCTKPATALVLVLESEPKLGDKKEIDSLEIVGSRADSFPLVETYSFASEPLRASLPGTLVITKPESEDASDEIVVTVQARLGGKTVFYYQARLNYVDQETRMLRIPLRYSCMGISPCSSARATCRAGKCVPDAVNSAELPVFSADLAIGYEGESTTCFDKRDTKCRANIKAVDLNGFQAGGCVFNDIDPNKFNVFAHWKSTTFDGESVLDANSEEGWQPGSSPSQAKLSESMCQLVDKTIVELFTSDACAPKSKNQPICIPR